MFYKFNSPKLLLAFSLVTMLAACNNNQTASTATGSSATTAVKTDTTMAAAAPSGPTVPFNAVVIKHTVADYAKWRMAFDGDSAARNAAGLHTIVVSRGLIDSNEVEIPFQIDDVAKAKAFGADPRLKEAMKKGGVTSKPEMTFINVLRLNQSNHTPGNYMEVVQKVKDFDAWQKAFDAEGSDARAADGLQDGVLARGIDDPNLVYLVFDIKDVAAAKAAMEKPARQKIMQDAGCIGKPEVFFGRDQQ